MCIYIEGNLSKKAKAQRVKENWWQFRNILWSISLLSIKSWSNLILKKIRLVKAMVFPIVMYRCECQNIKKAEHWRIDAFELWCWRRLLRVPWTAWRSNYPILKEISPEYHGKDWRWRWSSNTLATWCKELTHLKRPWCWERLKAWEEGDERGWGGRMASPTQWTWVWVNSGSCWWTQQPRVLQSMGSQNVEHDWVTEVNWILTPTMCIFCGFSIIILHQDLCFHNLLDPIHTFCMSLAYFSSLMQGKY